MLKGHVFNLQTFTSEAFALFIDKFLNGRCGVAKGCELSNTNNTVTIREGYFVIRGRFLQIISNETISNLTTNGFYNLICEIDLSKINTKQELNQAKIKVISNTSNYSELQKQDITSEGKLYQYEFARFKVEDGNITNFEDKRTFVDFENIYAYLERESEEMFKEIRNALKNILSGSAYCLKDEILKQKVKDLKEKLENIDRVKAVVHSLASYIAGTMHEPFYNDEWLIYNGFYKEILGLLYFDKVKEIINSLNEENAYREKLKNWLNEVKIFKNVGINGDFETLWDGELNAVMDLTVEKENNSFLIPKSNMYPNFSLLTIITDLYNSLS